MSEAEFTVRFVVTGDGKWAKLQQKLRQPDDSLQWVDVTRDDGQTLYWLAMPPDDSTQH